MRFVTVTNSGGGSETIYAPVVASHEYTLSLAGMSAGIGDETLLQDDPASGTAALHLEEAVLLHVASDGVEADVYVTQETVGDALDDLGIVLGEYDYTEPELSAACTDGMSITVHRVEYRDYTIRETIPHETVVEYTSVQRRTPEKELVTPHRRRRGGEHRAACGVLAVRSGDGDREEISGGRARQRRRAA